MDYLKTRLEARRHPESVLPGARGILMLGAYYGPKEQAADLPGRGTIGHYARFLDYHDILRKRLKELRRFFQREVPQGIARGVVDTAPLMERQFAVEASLGQFGKNTMLLHPRFGSRFFLAALLTSEPLGVFFRERSSPDTTVGTIAGSEEIDSWSPCTNCRACLDACPTGALESPYVMNAKKCLNYWTIEYQGTIPTAIRRRMGKRLFGCDTCQDVCPWNAHLPCLRHSDFRSQRQLRRLNLVDLFDLNEEDFQKRFAETPLGRLGRSGLLRNAAYVLANAPERHATPALFRGLLEASPVVRQACIEALAAHHEVFPEGNAKRLLHEHLSREQAPELLTFMKKALAEEQGL
jgi:epoxyqueuosine reductase